MAKTIKSKILIIFVLLTAVLMLLSKTSMVVSANTDIPSPAKAMCVIDGNTDTVLYSKNSHDRLAMASTTKIATAIVAIENTDNLDEKFVVSDKAVGIEGTSIYIQEGEELTMRELLYGLMLASGNDCAVAIAEKFGYDNFIQMMNNLCDTLHLEDTHFDNPHGLDSETHYTSAYDLAMITDYALDNDIFREIVSTKRTTIDKTNMSEERFLKHKDKLLFTMDNCIGVKTGFTDNAGRCLVNAHDQNGMRIISVVLNCGPMFDECQRLTEMALQEYSNIELIMPYSYVGDVDVVNGQKNKISVVSIDGFTVTTKNVDIDRYSVKYDIPHVIEAPVELNSIIGKVYVYFDDTIIFTTNLYAIDETKNIDIRHILDEIISKW